MDKIAAAEPVSEDPDLIEPMAAFASALAHQIQTLATKIGKLDKQLQSAYAASPDHKLWNSFPGAGATLAPRLAAAWGSDRETSEVGDMQIYSGIAPVTERSGNSIWVGTPSLLPPALHTSDTSDLLGIRQAILPTLPVGQLLCGCTDRQGQETLHRREQSCLQVDQDNVRLLEARHAIRRCEIPSDTPAKELTTGCQLSRGRIRIRIG